MPIFALMLAAAGWQNLVVNSSPPAHDIYAFTMTDIDGNTVPLNKYRGKVLLVVNVASKCGFTPQYKDLEGLYESRKEKGLVILGFPANNFGQQEPGTDPQIKQFCTLNYGVSFPMFSKISVKGADEAPLYQWLIAHSDRPKDDIEWNFSKFVIDKNGHVIARYKSQTTPMDPALLATLDQALAQ